MIRMKQLRRVIVPLAMALLVLPLVASDAVPMDRNGRFFALGVGRRPCEDFVKFRQKNLDFTPEQHEIAQHVIQHWVAGFLTAHNFYVTDTYDVQGTATPEEMGQWLESYCKKNPKNHFAEAVIALTMELHPKRITTGTVSGQK
jgi:hypothetical protein